MAKKRVLVTGASGMLGATMVKLLNEKFIIVPSYIVFVPLLWKPKIK